MPFKIAGSRRGVLQMPAHSRSKHLSWHGVCPCINQTKDKRRQQMFATKCGYLTSLRCRKTRRNAVTVKFFGTALLALVGLVPTISFAQQPYVSPSVTVPV